MDFRTSLARDGLHWWAWLAGVAWLSTAAVGLILSFYPARLIFLAADAVLGAALVAMPTVRIIRIASTWATIVFMASIPALLNPAIANPPGLIMNLAAVALTWALWYRTERQAPRNPANQD